MITKLVLEFWLATEIRQYQRQIKAYICGFARLTMLNDGRFSLRRNYRMNVRSQRFERQLICTEYKGLPSLRLVDTTKWTDRRLQFCPTFSGNWRQEQIELSRSSRAQPEEQPTKPSSALHNRLCNHTPSTTRLYHFHDFQSFTGLTT
jgi:hypothetical protein